MKKWLALFTLFISCSAVFAANEISDSSGVGTTMSVSTMDSENAEETDGRQYQQQAPGETIIYYSITSRQSHAPKENEVIPDKQKKRKKIIAALLAFPLPFGIIGLHRIYLGTKPYVPLVYIATVGGVGIVPFIDFVVICLEKDISQYCNNPNIIMWAK